MAAAVTSKKNGVQIDPGAISVADAHDLQHLALRFFIQVAEGRRDPGALYIYPDRRGVFAQRRYFCAGKVTGAPKRLLYLGQVSLP